MIVIRLMAVCCNVTLIISQSSSRRLHKYASFCYIVHLYTSWLNIFFSCFIKVRAVENKVDFPTRHDWDSFFRDAKDMNETLPGERPDTIHLEGLPCRWFSKKNSQFPDRPSEDVLVAVFQTFGKVLYINLVLVKCC